MRNRFFQFGFRQLVLLVVVLSVLMAILAPRIRHVFETRQHERDARQLADAQQNLAEAIRKNDKVLAEAALRDGANPNHEIDQKSLLHLCIGRGQIPIAELLVVAGADVEHVEDLQPSIVPNGPPLFAAISCRQPTDIRLAMIRLLIRHGADVHTKVSGRSAMDLAVYHADAKVAGLLSELGLPYGPREMSAFNQLEQIRRVVSSDPGALNRRYDPIYAARPGRGPTLLGIALERGHRALAEFLIESGAPLDTIEGGGRTLLHLAAHGGDPQLIRLLVDRGLSPNAKDDYQDTPLTDSVWRAPPEAVSALIEAGADVNEPGMNGRTPLHIAVGAIRENSKSAAAHPGREEVIRILLLADADPTTPDENGNTALRLAQQYNPKLAELLVLPPASISE